STLEMPAAVVGSERLDARLLGFDRIASLIDSYVTRELRRVVAVVDFRVIETVAELLPVQRRERAFRRRGGRAASAQHEQREQVDSTIGHRCPWPSAFAAFRCSYRSENSRRPSCVGHSECGPANAC